MNTEKRNRFIRIVEARMAKTLDSLRLIKNCANRNNYDYTEEDVDLILTHISKAVKEIKDAYSAGLSKNVGVEFKLKK